MRLNTNAEVFSKLTEVGGISDMAAGEAGVLDAAAAAGDTTVDVVEDVTALVSGDFIRVGQDNELEVHEVDSVSGTGPFTVQLTTALVRDHAIGAEVQQVELLNYGAISDAGVNVDDSATVNEIFAATQFQVYVRLLQNQTSEFSWAMLNWSMENIAATLGIPESELTGSGTATAKDQLAVLGEALDSVQNYSLYFRGEREGGKLVEVMGFDASFDLNNAKNFLRGQQVDLPLAATVNGGYVIRQWDA